MEQFNDILTDVQARIKNEIKILFNSSAYTNLDKRLTSLDNVKNYSFQYQDIDLKKEVENQLKKESNLFLDETLSRLDYDASIANAKGDTQLQAKLREIKLLLGEEKFTTVIEVAHSYWFSSEPLRYSVIYSALRLAQEDPKTLENILRTLPPIGEVRK